MIGVGDVISPIDQFRLLVVDDEPEILKRHEGMFGSDEDVHLICAATQAEAIDAIDSHLLDAAIVDIEIGVEAGGYEVLRKFARSAPDTPLIVFTKHVDPAHVRDLLDLVTLEPPRIAAIVEKGPLGAGGPDPQALRMPISRLIDEWRASRVRITNAELPLALLVARAERIPDFRSDPVEVTAELDRICRRLFGDVRGLGDGADIGIEFKPLGSEGLSSAITVEAQVSVGDDVTGRPVTGSRCVLKIGPVADIREEADRYAQFVKYGVRLRQRVELLGEIRMPSLGAVCYSFAGGVFGSELVSLSKLLHSTESLTLAREAIASLCDASSRNWYAVQCKEQSALVYAKDTYHTDFAACFKRLDSGLGKLQRRLRVPELQETLGGFIGYSRADESADGALEIGGTILAIPRMNILGGGKFVAEIPACLVHGDMHGSNIMLELDEQNGDGLQKTLSRVCLIDYRSAGPGPRATDFVTLQASLRLADAKLILAEVCGDPEPEELSNEDLARAVVIAAKRTNAEARLLRVISSGAGAPDEGALGPFWEALDFEIISAMSRNFADLTIGEYLAASIPFTLRYFGYGIGPIARVRFLAWISAQFEAMREMTGELAVVT
jgi:CheY-like chemotaxis protein